MGEYKVEPVHLRLKDDAKPKYYWTRPSHFTLKAEVELELERLVDSDVLCPINSSEYATPIVAACKHFGSVRICGDYRGWNKDLEVELYPLPGIDYLFTELKRGARFSKIDLCNVIYSFS